MSDDLLHRLGTVDPSPDERVAAEARSLGDLPGRIVAGESPVADSVRSWPRLPRRVVSVAIALAVLAVGVAVPLALLRPLAGQQVAFGPVGDGWFRAGTLTALHRDGVTYLRQAHVFVVVSPDDEPFALSSWSPHMANEPLLFCQTSGWFFSPGHGETFDLHGNYELGPAPSGMASFPVRVVDGYVDVDTRSPVAGTARGAAGTDPRPSGPFCDEGSSRVRPGVVSAGARTPAIEVVSPVAGASVKSPVRIAGTADVFEATVSYRILGGRKQVLAEGFTTASCGTGCRGDFSVRVPFAVTHGQPGVIQVFEVSAEDGSQTNLVEVPVALTAAGPPSPSPTTPPPASNDAITVLGPVVGATVSSPLTISGNADVFEAVVSYRILDAHGLVVAEGTTMATCGSGCRGDFSARVRFTIDHRQAGTIQVFEVSAKDGSDTNVVEVPVVLVP